MIQDILTFIQEYGYLGIFVLLALGIVGLPIPDEAIMTFIGYLVFKGTLSYPFAILSVVFGSVTGITISYFLGLKLGLPFLKRVGPKIYITEKKIEQTQKYFQKYGSFMIFVGYFIPGVRHLTGYFTGMAKLSIRKFLAYAFSGAAFWGITFITMGSALGNKFDMVMQYMEKHAFHSLLGGSILIVFIVVLILMNRKKK